MNTAKICFIMFLALLGRTGLSQALKESPEWLFKTSAPVLASPVIENSRLFVGSLDSSLYALDALTGKLLWKKKTGGQIRSAVCTTDDMVLFVSGDGYVYALDQNSGSQKWRFRTKGEKEYELYSYADYFYSIPVVHNGVVYVGSGDGNLYALNLKTGKKLWSFQTGSVIHSRAFVDSSSVFVSSFDGYVYALELKSGRARWKFKSVGHRFFPKGEFQGNIAGDTKRIYVGARDYNIYALDKLNGYAHWNRTFELGWAMGMPVIHDSVLYIGTSDDKLMLAFDPVSGRRLWSTHLGFNIFGGAAVVDSLVFVGTLMGKLFALDKHSGEIKQTWNTENYRNNKTQFFKEDDTYRDDIKSIILQGSDFIKMYYSLGAIFSTPVIVNRILYVTSTDGNVYSFSLHE